MNLPGGVTWLWRFEAASQAWLARLWPACWQSGLFVLLAWGVCRLLPGLSLRVRHGLWLLACARLLLGLMGAAPLVVPIRAGSLPTALLAPAPPRPAPLVSWQGTGRDADGRSGANLLPARATSPLTWRAGLFALWLGGVGWGLARLGRQAMALRRVCRDASPLNDSELGAQAREVGALLGLARLPRVAESKSVAAPLVVGPLRPLILLPPDFAARFSPNETRLALAHELAHIRGGDLWLALVPALAQILFFFFPLAWLACREWAMAREALRDQDALRVTNAPPGDYGRLLLKMVAQDTALCGSDWRSALGMTAGYDTLQRRLVWMKRPAHAARSAPRLLRLAGAPAAVPVLALLTPWRLQAAAVPAPSPNVRAAPDEDPAQIPALDLRAGGNARKRYLLIGSGAPAPAGGYHLLIVLPGGDGSDEFQSFVKRAHAWGLPPGYLVAELIAPRWSQAQAHTLV